MEVGLAFALISAVCFSLSQVFVRRGVFQARESFSAIPVTVFVGALLFSFLLLFTAEGDKLWSLSWQGFLLLGTAGIIHFVAGRFSNYTSVRLIGANRAGALMRSELFFAVTFGILILNESLTTFLVFGVLCIAAGAILVSLGREGEISKIRGKGILAGVVAGFCYGITGILIKPAVREIGSPFAAAFVSYAAATLIAAAFLLRREQRGQVLQLNRQSLISLVISGVFVSTAQLFRYVALSHSPVSVVQPLIGTSPIFVLLFSFLLNRNIEVFSWKVITGVVVVALGASLLFH